MVADGLAERAGGADVEHPLLEPGFEAIQHGPGPLVAELPTRLAVGGGDGALEHEQLAIEDQRFAGPNRAHVARLEETAAGVAPAAGARAGRSALDEVELAAAVEQQPARKAGEVRGGPFLLFGPCDAEHRAWSQLA